MHVVVDSYYVHYMGNDNKLETAKLLSQYVQNVHEVSGGMLVPGRTITPSPNQQPAKWGSAGSGAHYTTLAR